MVGQACLDKHIAYCEHNKVTIPGHGYCVVFGQQIQVERISGRDE
jgi:hypothetical protein